MSDIEKLLDKERWAEARALIQDELVSAPMDHWLWMMLSLTYYEERQYEKALQCSKRAVELQPDCPMALWHYAGSLFMNERADAALAVWTLLLNTDLEEVAYGDCGEGMDMALQLINDVHYRMGQAFLWKGLKEQARTSFEKYLHNRSHGVGSIYDRKEVEKKLASLVSDGKLPDSPKKRKRAAKP